MGAKNHAVIMPDAHQEQALNGIIGAAFGAAGQRCMAISVAVFVGSASDMIPALVSKAKALKVGCGADTSVDIGPLIRLFFYIRLMCMYVFVRLMCMYVYMYMDIYVCVYMYIYVYVIILS
jgi:acyl-CoA reductase-like NAD-dependent aldehyde dehydrogenase